MRGALTMEFRLDDLAGFPEIFGHQVWTHVSAFGELAYFAFPAADENGAASGPNPSL